MRLLLAVLLWAVPASALSPGEGVLVRFKDGSALSGVLLALGEGRVEFQVSGARLSWPLSAVERLERQDNALSELRRLEREAGADAAKRAAAAEFALRRGLRSEYGRLARELGLFVPAAPAPAETPAEPARPALGFNAAPPGLPVAPPTAFAAQPIVQAAHGVVFIPISVAPRPAAPAERQALLREQAARREAFRRDSSFVLTPERVLQFRLNEALERSAAGLPFSSEPL